MITRRTVLGVGLASVVAGCTPKERQPEPSNAPTNAPSRQPVSRVLDLTELMANTPRSAAATAATRSAARVWVDNTNEGKRNVVTGVHLGNGLFLSVEHLRRRTVFGTAEDPIELTGYRARLAIPNAAGSLAVVRATEAAWERDFVTDASLFRVDDMPGGIAVASRVALTDLQRGTTLHHVGYQPAPGTNEFSIPIDRPAPQAGVRLALLTNSGSQFHAIAGLGPSEGDFSTNTFGEGSSGGPVYTSDGRLVGTAVSHRREPLTIGELLDNREFGIFDRVVNNGQDVPRDTIAQLVTCQAIDGFFLEQLEGGLAPIPSPGY